MKKTILILLLSIATNLMAQKDTLYFKLDTVCHTNWLSSSKKDAEFYRPMPLKKVGNLYQIKGYYVDGNIQMEGFCTDPQKDIYHGKAIWYHKNGNIEIESIYNEGELDGLKKTYFKDGTLKTEGTYKDDNPLYGTFNDCCPYATVDERKEGKRIASYRYYKNTKVIAKKSILNNEGHTIKIFVYNKKGEQIAEIIVEPIQQFIDGKNVWFNIDKDKNLLNIEGYTTYKNGMLEGEAIDFDPKGNLIAKGIYHEGIPYSGTFFNEEIFKTYTDGKLEGKEITYSENKIIAQGINKNGNHWKGQFKYGNYEIVSYINGQLEGKQTTYYTDSFILKGIKSYHHIVNNKKEGESAYFNKKGKELAKGIYKNDQTFTGTFYDTYYNTLSSFKDGKKHGLFFQYDNEGNITAQQEYANDKKIGKIKSTGVFRNKICECLFKDEEPFEGEVCEDTSILIYTSGKIIKRETYTDGNLDALEKTTIYNTGGEIAQSTTYHDDKSYVLIYKKGKPFKGQEYSTYDERLMTYKQGAKNGPFTEYTYNHIFIKGNYKDNLWNGTLTFTDRIHNRTTTCTYTKEKPIDGTVISSKCMSTYKNGLKSGLETCTKNLYFKINNEYELVYDSITQNYNKGELHGKVQYFKKGKRIAEGFYLNNSPKEGTFYINKIFGKIYADGKFENSYKDGKLVTSTYNFGNYKMVDIFENHLIAKVITYKNDAIIYEGTFKSGVEFIGDFITIDNKSEPKSFIHTQYKKGKKHGKEQTINLLENRIESTNTYKEGVLLRKVKKFPFKGLDSIIGVYKNEKTFSGHFYTKKSTIEKIEHYKKGIKKGFQYYYSTTGSLLKPILDSINYIKGKPYDGIDLEVGKNRYHKHFYKKGKRTQTDVYGIYYQGISDPPYFRITYTNTGFITSKPNDSIFEKYNELIYTNTAKTEGKVVFYTESEKGYLKFKNGKFIDVQIKSKLANISFTMYIEKPNTLTVHAKNKEIDIKMYLDFKLANPPSYKDLLSINDLFFKGDGVAHFYLDNKFFGKCTLKKGEPFHGIVIRQYKDGLFTYAKYTNGVRVEKKKGITKEELLKLKD